MSTWNKNKVLPQNVNNGNEYANGDVPSQDTLNAANNNAFYATDFAEAMADTPDTSEAGQVGVPSVSLIDNVKNGHTYKKFKFSSLKGDLGATGATGISYRARGEYSASETYVNDSSYIDTVSYNGSTYYCKVTSTGNLPTDAIYFGILAQRGSDVAVSILQSTGSSQTAVMSQDANTRLFQQKLGAESVTVEDSFISRVTAGLNNEIVDGSTAKVTSIKGRTVKQLLDPSGYSATTTNSGVTFTNNGDGTITANGTATDFSYMTLSRLTLTPGHKYLLAGTPAGSFGDKVGLQDNKNYQYEYGHGVIYEATYVGTSKFTTMVSEGIQISNYTFKPQLFDLTEIFGEGNEPTTVADFKKYVGNTPFLPYGLADSTVDAIKSTGTNIISGEDFANRIVAQVSGAVKDTTNKTITYAASAISGKRFYEDIPWAKNTQYTFILRGYNTSATDRETNLTIEYTDNTTTWLGFTTAGTTSLCVQQSAAGKTIRCLKGGDFEASTVLCYDYVACIQGARTASDYQPYWSDTLNLGAVYTLKGVGTVCDEIDFVKQKLIRRITSTDNGTTALISDGTTSYYALDTPTELAVTLLDEYRVDNWGMETILSDTSPNTNAVVAPETFIEYAKDIGKQVRTNTENIQDLQNANTTLQAKTLADFSPFIVITTSPTSLTFSTLEGMSSQTVAVSFSGDTIIKNVTSSITYPTIGATTTVFSSDVEFTASLTNNSAIITVNALRNFSVGMAKLNITASDIFGKQITKVINIEVIDY